MNSGRARVVISEIRLEITNIIMGVEVSISGNIFQNVWRGQEVLNQADGLTTPLGSLLREEE